MLRQVVTGGVVVLLLAGCVPPPTESVTPNGSRLVLPGGVEAVAFDTTAVRVISGGDTVRVLAEVARTGAQKERGLMYRTAMPAMAGMLFVYDEPFEGSFWMLDTPLPLSVALADSAGVIREIVAMEPCVDRSSSECTIYDAGEPFQYALEMNRGWFAEHGIRAGARLAWRR